MSNSHHELRGGNIYGSPTDHDCSQNAEYGETILGIRVVNCSVCGRRVK